MRKWLLFGLMFASFAAQAQEVQVEDAIAIEATEEDDSATPPTTEDIAPEASVDTSSEALTSEPAVDAQQKTEEEPAPPAEAPQPQKIYTAVKLRGLNKTTTRSEELRAVIGSVTRFGNLEIIARGCWVAPPDRRPEQAGLVEVWYGKQNEKSSLLFYGWLFASSPSLASLEHPIYDLTMLECLETAKKDAPDKTPDKAPDQTPNKALDKTPKAEKAAKKTPDGIPAQKK